MTRDSGFYREERECFVKILAGAASIIAGLPALAVGTAAAAGAFGIFRISYR